MQSTLSFPKFPIPWGNSASGAYIRSIPTPSQATTSPGAASLTDGFPPVCAVPVAAGGVPPFMQDFNGILNIITAWQQWYQAGGSIKYDAVFQAQISGYPLGATVESVTTPGRLWKSTVENNTTNPDVGGGSGWVIANTGRLVAIRSLLTAGTFTYFALAGTTFIVVTVVGGGGSGAGAGGSSGFYAVGSGGASGSVAVSLLRAGFSGVTVVVGKGGAPFAGGNGNAGGTSSFGSLLSAPGGGGGLTEAAPTGVVGFAGQGIPGAVGIGGNIYNACGQPGLNGLLQGLGPMSGQGGASILGGGAQNASILEGHAAQSPGGGGGGAGATDQNRGPNPGGAGGDGAVIIQEYSSDC
jgi:hypothetical protein